MYFCGSVEQVVGKILHGFSKTLYMGSHLFENKLFGRLLIRDTAHTKGVTIMVLFFAVAFNE